MNDQELEILYTQQLSEELVLQTRGKINQFIETHPVSFGMDMLFTAPANNGNMPEELAKLYQEVCSYYNDNAIQFDHVWVSILVYRTEVAVYHLTPYSLQELVVYLETTARLQEFSCKLRCRSDCKHFSSQS